MRRHEMRWAAKSWEEEKKGEKTWDETGWGEMRRHDMRWNQIWWEKMRKDEKWKEMSEDREDQDVKRSFLHRPRHPAAVSSGPGNKIKSWPSGEMNVFAFLYISITWTWNGSNMFQTAQQCLQKAGIGKKHMKRIETWCSKMFDRVSKPVKETNHSSIKNSFIELCFSILWNVKHFSDPPMSKKVAEMIRDGENLTHHAVKLK